MSLKQRIDFSEPETKDSTVALDAQRLFDEKDTFEITAPTAAEQSVVSVLQDQSKKSRWGLKAIVGGFIGLTLWQSVDTMVTAFSSGDWLSLGWGGLIGLVSLVGAHAIGREAWYLQRLKRRQTEREYAETLLESDGVGKAKAFCQQLVEKQNRHSEGYDRWLHSLSAAHNDREVLELFDSMVLTQQDEQARKLVAKHAKEAGLMVAVSPLATADMLLVAWRTLAMVNRLCELYGVELSYLSRVAMLKMLVRNMALIGASEIALDAGVDMLSLDITGKVSVRAAQGLGVGLLTARLGLRTMAMLRPVPWLGEAPLKLSDVRKDLLKQLRIGSTSKQEA
uniref:YcjF family protein n=1 Tax=Thaumasiovibrio occultus TaxID=1891184 RepID=UPI000B359071|nr:TIGR01620 family protein [Thaumasiovibrio occultus]